MKKTISAIVTFSAILITAGLLTGCGAAIITKDVGPTTTREYDFTDFTSIEIGHAMELEVTPANTYSLSIDANESTFDHIKVSQTGNKLKIDADNIFLNFGRSQRVRVKITMPELRGLSLSGASQGDVAGFKSPQDFDLTLSGASQLNIDMETGDFKCELSGASQVTAYLKATHSNISLSGASKIRISGSGGNIMIDASGASRANLPDFSVNDADIGLSGSSDATLDIKGRLNTTLSGASTLEYTGTPLLGNIHISGGSQLNRR